MGLLLTTKTLSANTLERMSLGDAIHFLLHRAGVGVDVEGDGHGRTFVSPANRPSWPDLSGHPRLALIRKWQVAGFIS